MEEKQIEVKQVSEREFLVGGDRIYLDEGNIICINGAGESDEKKAITVKDAAIRLVNLSEEKKHILCDLNKTGRQSPESRKIWSELAAHEKVGKVALYGLHPVARVIASFIIGISRKKDFRFFNTKEDALAWLKEVKNG